MSKDDKPVEYMPENKPGKWESGTLERGTVEKHSGLAGNYYTADVRDSDDKLHEGVTVIPPDKK